MRLEWNWGNAVDCGRELCACVRELLEWMEKVEKRFLAATTAGRGLGWLGEVTIGARTPRGDGMGEAVEVE